MDYCSALKTNGTPTHATTWMNFEVIILSYKTANTIWFQLHEVPKVVRVEETEGRMMDARD
jgi:hypothetical protein